MTELQTTRWFWEVSKAGGDKKKKSLSHQRQGMPLKEKSKDEERDHKQVNGNEEKTILSLTLLQLRLLSSPLTS